MPRCKESISLAKRVKMGNPNDRVRDAILRYLYKLHRSARGPRGVATKIRDLHAAMKRQGISSKEVNSNLDYLIQKGWVKEVVTERAFTTPQGTVRKSEVHSYKISDIGIDKLEGASIYSRVDRFQGINITNIKGVTVVGSGNAVNMEYSDLYEILDNLQELLNRAENLSDEDKLNATADIESLKNQLSKSKPNRDVIARLWSSIQKIVTGAGMVEVACKVATLIAPFLS